jgi:hypothetical protein
MAHVTTRIMALWPIVIAVRLALARDKDMHCVRPSARAPPPSCGLIVRLLTRGPHVSERVGELNGCMTTKWLVLDGDAWRAQSQHGQLVPLPT